MVGGQSEPPSGMERSEQLGRRGTRRTWSDAPPLWAAPAAVPILRGASHLDGLQAAGRAEAQRDRSRQDPLPARDRDLRPAPAHAGQGNQARPPYGDAALRHGALPLAAAEAMQARIAVKLRCSSERLI